jgi:hypothetical protein
MGFWSMAQKEVKALFQSIAPQFPKQRCYMEGPHAGNSNT